MGRAPIDYLEKVTEASLTGDLWYSKKQWSHLRDANRDRTFARLTDGRIVEYTELITVGALLEDPLDRCFYEDAVLVGKGAFAYFADEQGREYR
jgi:hypothetical protein